MRIRAMQQIKCSISPYYYSVTTLCRGRPRGCLINNPKRCAGYKYRRSADGDEAAGHSFRGCRTSNTRASVKYTKLTEDESSSNSLDVLQRSRTDLYLNCNSKEEQRSTR
ncbi:hypothetical protein V1477_001427 [Vespula maculifrons]|uniref:Uncharacterized protein n=1 Tax=Vespula maculifrons TaxID=7453 RepID=A0ABD2CYW9_VESMC